MGQIIGMGLQVTQSNQPVNFIAIINMEFSYITSQSHLLNSISRKIRIVVCCFQKQLLFHQSMLPVLYFTH